MIDRSRNPIATDLEAVAAQLQALGAEGEVDRKVKRTVPWVLSVAIHAAVLVIAVLVAGTVRMVQQRNDGPLIVADFNAMTYDPVVREATEPAEVDEPVTQDRVHLDSLDQSLQEKLDQLQLEVIPGLGDLAAAASPPRFQPTAIDGGATFLGVTATNARRIVYVIDASGSLIASLQVVVRELARSLQDLTPRQEFSVIFFQQDRALMVPPANRLLRADDKEKVRALKWIDRNVIPNGSSNPLPALRRAIELKPDVIFLLSDSITGAGPYEIDQAQLLQQLDEMNPANRDGRRRVQINCVQFLDPDPLRTLFRIAAVHGGPGGYKFLDREELGLAP